MCQTCPWYVALNSQIHNYAKNIHKIQLSHKIKSFVNMQTNQLSPRSDCSATQRQRPNVYNVINRKCVHHSLLTLWYGFIIIFMDVRKTHPMPTTRVNSLIATLVSSSRTNSPTKRLYTSKTCFIANIDVEPYAQPVNITQTIWHLKLNNLYNFRYMHHRNYRTYCLVCGYTQDNKYGSLTTYKIRSTAESY